MDITFLRVFICIFVVLVIHVGSSSSFDSYVQPVDLVLPVFPRLTSNGPGDKSILDVNIVNFVQAYIMDMYLYDELKLYMIVCILFHCLSFIAQLRCG